MTNQTNITKAADAAQSARSFSNIEKSAFHRGEYVGYARGVYRIAKTNSSYGNWWAQPVPLYASDGTLRPTLYAMRLSEMNAKLSALNSAA